MGPSPIVRNLPMASNKNRKTVPGSEKQALPHAKVIGDVDPKQRIEVTVVLRPRASGGARGQESAAKKAMAAAARLPERRKYVSREAFAAEHGADPTDVEKVE